MLKHCVLFAIAFIVQAPLLQAQAINANSITGAWLSADKSGRIEISAPGGKYGGRLVWMKTPADANGNPVKDGNNPDEKLKSRAVLNIDILTGFVYDDGVWRGGKIYDPKTGKTYKANLTLKDGTLELHCYTGLPMFGKTIV